MHAYQFLKRGMQLANSVLEDEADSSIGSILGQNIAHDILRILLILLVVETSVLFDYSDADNLVAVVYQLIQQPLDSIVRVGVLVDSNHEAARSSPGIVAFVSDVERERESVVLGSLATRYIVETNVVLKPVVDCLCQRRHYEPVVQAQSGYEKERRGKKNYNDTARIEQSGGNQEET